MTKNLYPKGAEKMLRGAINFEADTLKVALLSTSYTYSTSHEFFSDVAAHMVGTPKELTGKTAAGGIFDADDAEFGAIPAGSTIGAFVVFKSTGMESTSPLIEYSTEATGFPAATNGGTVTVPWSDSAAKIISLVV